MAPLSEREAFTRNSRALTIHGPWRLKVTHGDGPCPERPYDKSFEVCLKANSAYLHLGQGVRIHFAGTVRVALQRLNLLASNSSHWSFALAEKKVDADILHLSSPETSRLPLRDATTADIATNHEDTKSEIFR